MSHFTVLVIGDKIEKQLQPYHEYECTGIVDEYVIFVEASETEEELIEDYEPHKSDYPTIEQFMKDFHGYRQNEDGKWGRLTNPDAQWDWWVIGGRWRGYFKLKPGAKGELGKPGAFGGDVEPGTADSALKKDIDFETMRQDAEDFAAKTYDLVFETIKDTEPSENWGTILARYSDNVDKAREAYNVQERVTAFRELTLTRRDLFGFFASVEDFDVTREEYLKKARNSAVPTYAIVKDSTWYEKGNMGWWGVSSNEMEDDEWNEKFNELIDSVPDDTLFTLVDAHI